MSLWKVILILTFMTAISFFGFKVLVNLEQSPRQATLGRQSVLQQSNIPICKEDCKDDVLKTIPGSSQKDLFSH